MSEKVAILITALAVFVLISDFTLKAKREEIEPVVDKKDFFFKDFLHDTSVAGSWTGKDYVINMQIKSLALNMKLMFKDKNGSGDFNSKTDYNGTPDKYGKINNVQRCLRNATLPLHNKTCKPRPLGFMMRSWIACEGIAATVTGWAWNGVTRTGNTVRNVTVTMADKVYSGVKFVADWSWDKMTWMAEEAWDRAMWMAEWSWETITWLFESIWCHVTWLADGVWDIVTWSGNVIATFYADYLKSHVTNIKIFLADLTWKDVFRIMATVFAVNLSVLFVYMITTYAVNFLRRRRQFRSDKEAAVTKKPIWRPKPKKKRRKNKNDW